MSRFPLLQAKEIRRLNSVYNKLLADTGVELIGAQCAMQCPGKPSPSSNPQCRPVHAEGRAKLCDSHTVEVALSSGGMRTLKAKHILLACGSRPHRIAFPGSVSPSLLADAVTGSDARAGVAVPGKPTLP